MTIHRLGDLYASKIYSHNVQLFLHILPYYIFANNPIQTWALILVHFWSLLAWFASLAFLWFSCDDTCPPEFQFQFQVFTFEYLLSWDINSVYYPLLFRIMYLFSSYILSVGGPYDTPLAPVYNNSYLVGGRRFDYFNVCDIELISSKCHHVWYTHHPLCIICTSSVRKW